MKPFDPYELHARLTVGKRILDLQNSYLTACEELRLQAARDSLTHLWNHGAILDRLDQELSRAERQRLPMGVLMADLDLFKQINDTYGHATGDEVLRHVANTLKHLVRPYDSVGRYGGEEFLFVLPNCDRASTIGLAERLREEVARQKIEQNLQVTVSIGATSREGGEPIRASELLRQADSALYKAKHGGRNRVEFLGATPEPENKTSPPSGAANSAVLRAMSSWLAPLFTARPCARDDSPNRRLSARRLCPRYSRAAYSVPLQRRVRVSPPEPRGGAASAMVAIRFGLEIHLTNGVILTQSAISRLPDRSQALLPLVRSRLLAAAAPPSPRVSPQRQVPANSADDPRRIDLADHVAFAARKYRHCLDRRHKPRGAAGQHGFIRRPTVATRPSAQLSVGWLADARKRRDDPAT